MVVVDVDEGVGLVVEFPHDAKAIVAAIREVLAKVVYFMFALSYLLTLDLLVNIRLISSRGAKN